MKRFLLTYPFFCIIWGVLPVLMGCIAYSIFFHSIPTNLPIGIIDEDKSTASKELIFLTQSSPTLNIAQYYHSLSEAKEDISQAKIYGVVVIPKDFQTHIKRKIGSGVALYYNAQFVLIGKALNTTFLQVLTLFNAKNTIAANLAKDTNIIVAQAKALPIIPTIQAYFNPNNDYAQFLLTVILPCIWQILVAVGMLNLINNMPKNLNEILVKLIINVTLALLWGYSMLYTFLTLGYPMQGDINVILLGLLIFAIAISGIVICLQSILKDSAKSISVIAAYIAPSLAFAGITYPQNSMETFAAFWSNILPISYFMKLYLQQANYAMDIRYSLHTLVEMLPFLLFLLLGMGIYS
ncbi:ABC transporter permease, partial [Helicobacter aurati]